MSVSPKMGHQDVLGFLSGVLLSLAAFISFSVDIPRTYIIAILAFSLIVKIGILRDALLKSPISVHIILTFTLAGAAIPLVAIEGSGPQYAALGKQIAIFLVLLDAVLLAHHPIMLRRYFLSFSVSLATLGAVSLLGFYLGSEIFSNRNHYASVFVALVFYTVLNSESRTFFITALVVLLISYTLNARLVSVIILSLILVKICNGCMLRLFVAATLLLGSVSQWYASLLFDQEVNAALSNRQMLWAFYVDSLRDEKWFGLGFLGEDLPRAAANFLSMNYDRGFASEYGTQSMFLLYAVEGGLLSAMLALSLITWVVLISPKYGAYIGVLSVALLLESVKIGSPNAYGILIAVLFVYAVSEQRHRKLMHNSVVENNT